MTFEYGTLERIRAGIACYVAEYFEIAAVVWHVKYSIDGMIEQLDFFGVIGPVLFLWKSQNKMSVCVFKQHDGWMDAYDGWMAGNALRDALILTFRRRFLRTTRTPLTDICMVTLRFFRFCTLHSYCGRERKGRCKHARQRYKCHGGRKFARIFN